MDAVGWLSGLIIVAAFFLIAMAGSIYDLRRHHSVEIYAIWYVFSLSFLIFLALDVISITSKTKIPEIFGESYSSAVSAVYDALTNEKAELLAVSIFIYIGIFPQLLAYLLSGMSGSAVPPRWVRQIGTLAIWSLLKFLAALSGILLANSVVNWRLGDEVKIQELVRGIIYISMAFILAMLQHRYLDMELIPEIEFNFYYLVRLHVKAPIVSEIFSAIHDRATKYSRKDKTNSEASLLSMFTHISPEKQTKFLTMLLRSYRIISRFARNYPLEPIATSPISTAELIIKRQIKIGIRLLRIYKIISQYIPILTSPTLGGSKPNGSRSSEANAPPDEAQIKLLDTPSLSVNLRGPFVVILRHNRVRARRRLIRRWIGRLRRTLRR